jgi:hypothetical protein
MDDPVIVAWISDKDSMFPDLYDYPKGYGYLNKLLLDRTEGLVMILAHEFRHLWQTDIPDGCKLPERKASSHWLSSDAGVMSGVLEAFLLTETLMHMLFVKSENTDDKIEQIQYQEERKNSNDSTYSYIY